MHRLVGRSGGARLLALALAAGVVTASQVGSPGALAATTHHKIAPYIPVNIQLTAPVKVTSGAPIAVSVVVTSSGVPVRDHLVRFYAAGIYLGAAKTNSVGHGATTLRKALPVGTWTLLAAYKGGGPIESATASQTITVVAAPLSIRVVPYVPHSIAVSIDGAAPVSPNSDGFINEPLPKGGQVTLVAEVQNPSSNVRVAFVSWSNGDTATTRVMSDRSHAYTQIALQVSYLTPIKFTTAAGVPIPPSQVQGVTLSGPDGTKVAVGGSGQAWLTTPAPRRSPTGQLTVGADTYTVVDASYLGVNVANQGKDRFSPGPGGVWKVGLDVYPVSILSRNTVLGSQVAATVLLHGQGSTSRLLHLPARGPLSLTLPRGRYSLKVKGGGFGPGLDFRVSGPTVVPVPLLTILDLAGGLLLLLLIAGGLLALGPGRRRLVAWMFAGDLRARGATSL